MNEQSLLAEIVSRIRDARYLFLLALIIVVGGLSLFSANPSLTWGVLAGGFGLVVLLTILDYRKSVREALRMSVALTFPPDVDPATLNLVKCEYVVQDTRNPEQKRKGLVVPYPAVNGWLCPVPDTAAPGDRVEMWVIDDTGKRWPVRAFVPENLWASVEVRTAN